MEESQIHEDSDIVSGIYDGYKDTQREILAIETRKASYKLFTIAVVLLIFNIIAVGIAGIPLSYVLFQVLLFPLIFGVMGLLAFKEPLLAIILGMLVMFGYWIYIAAVFDTRTLLQGWIGKAIIIYLLLAGLQNAREAHRIRRELAG
ncbi:MAG TPA: hypothetical protein VGO58_05890 [Chitinophagaceae bacterium]|jgi:hypothetical protein|nr:hypothetical protein [Chitinophagaceae bacterium]